MAQAKRSPPRLLAIEALRVLCVEWQARLGLQGYVIDVRLVRASALPDRDCIGWCDALTTKRKARIRLLDPQDYEDPDETQDDHETVLVHELLHVLLPSRVFVPELKDDDLRVQLYEQGIDQLARTLVALKRSTP